MADRVKYEQVADAANRIEGRGEAPTVRGIRNELGSGSLSTIQGHFKRWKEERKAVKPECALPVSVQGAILTEIARQVTASRQELEDQLSDAQAIVSELENKDQEKEQIINDQNKKISEFEKAVAVRDDRIQKLEKEFAATTKELEKEKNMARDCQVRVGQAELNAKRAEAWTADITKDYKKIQLAILAANKNVSYESERAAVCETRLEVVGQRLQDAQVKTKALKEMRKENKDLREQLTNFDKRASVAEAKLKGNEELLNFAEKRIADFEARELNNRK